MSEHVANTSYPGFIGITADAHLLELHCIACAGIHHGDFHTQNQRAHFLHAAQHRVAGTQSPCHVNFAAVAAVQRTQFVDVFRNRGWIHQPEPSVPGKQVPQCFGRQLDSCVMIGMPAFHAAVDQLDLEHDDRDSAVSQNRRGIHQQGSQQQWCDTL